MSFVNDFFNHFDVKPSFYTDENGNTYSDRKMIPVERVEDVAVDSICACTLSSIVDYIGGRVNDWVKNDKMIIHVESPTKVLLTNELKSNGCYNCYVNCKFNGNPFNFGRFMDTESFIVELQTGFVNNENLVQLQKVASNICVGSELSVSDDGISQNCVVKTGAALKSKLTVNNPVYLKPYRTFPEIEQVESPFVFRIRDNNNQPTCALIQSNSTMWEVECIKRIKEWLKKEINALDESFIKNNRIVIMG